MAKDPNTPDDTSSLHEAAGTGDQRGKGTSGFLLASVLLVAWTVCAVAVLVALRMFALNFDFAIVNVITLILLFLLFCSYLAWFTFLTPLPKAVRFTPGIVCLVVVALLFAVLKIDRTDGSLIPSFRYRWQPAADRLLEQAVVEQDQAVVDLASTTPDDFPQFLGPRRTGRLDGPRLARDWTQNPPRLLWRRPVGAGWSAFAVVNGFAVTMEQRDGEELVTCYQVETGELCWVNRLEARHETLFGGVGPRSTPTIDQGRVYALGATGILRCLDGTTGETLWSRDLLRQFGTTVEQESSVLAWGRSNSPLIVDQLVVLPAGGPPGGPYQSLVALNKETGDVVWTAGDRQISYSSPSLVTLGGQRQIVSVNEDNISGHAPEDGRQLWAEPWPGNSASNASVSQTHPLAEDRLLITKGYGEGAAVIQIQGQAEPFTTSKLWWQKNLLKTKFTQVCVIDGFAYGLSDGILECVDLSGEGRRMWKKPRYGHGQILAVSDLLLVLGEDGDLMLVAASPDEFQELGKVESALDGQTWNNLALFGNRLLIRNAREAACYELPTVDAPQPAPRDATPPADVQ